MARTMQIELPPSAANTSSRTTRVTANLAKLQPVDTILDRLKATHRTRKYFDFQRGSDMNLTWDASKQTYMGKFEGETFPLSKTALQTGIKFAGIPSAEFLIGKPPQRFIENMYDRAEIEGGLRVAVSDKEILGFVEPSFQFMTDYQLIEGAIQGIDKRSMRGIEVAEHNDGQAIDYRLVFGESVMKKDDVMTMINLTLSEYGLYQNECTLGLWRLVCLNGMLSAEKSQTAKWSHRGEKSTGKFMETMCKIISEANEFGKAIGKQLVTAQNLKLSAPVAYIVHAMKELKLLRARIHDHLQFEAGGRDFDTAYDFWNLMTDAAKVLPLHQRHRLERDSMAYLDDMARINVVAYNASEKGVSVGDDE